SSARSLGAHIAIMSTLAATLSALMNNVAALAMLMPVDLQAAAKGKRSPALTLMPLSFASILGGMITLIGTPPNIVIAEFRASVLGEPYQMLDFAPVGLVCALVGVTFVALVGWRLIPSANTAHDIPKEIREIESYIAEVKVSEGSFAEGKKISELDDVTQTNEVEIVGLVRRGDRLPGSARKVVIRKGDILTIKASPESLEKFVGLVGLEYARKLGEKGAAPGLVFKEVVVPDSARIARRSATSIRLLSRRGVTLVGVSRQGKRITDRVRRMEILPGDVLLLLGDAETIEETILWTGCLPLAGTDVAVLQRGKGAMAAGIFGAAVLLASFGIVYLPVALAAAVVVLIVAGIVPIRKLYDSVEWPVIVLLGSMIPIGSAMESVGAATLVAESIVNVTAGFSPVIILTLLMVITMCLSDVMNNTATVVIAAPIAFDIARRLDVNPDPFLMTVAVAASCAFLTPIGHKNNTLIMGPGGYRFGDYWRMGLPLEILIIAVSVPMILWVWPLHG
ncbi:MAG: SLC13 family permease, partial [Verrucomicrobia bacterium]|nr:SLC13 family permease [Verrucomicrobiota bacterium]